MTHKSWKKTHFFEKKFINKFTDLKTSYTDVVGVENEMDIETAVKENELDQNQNKSVIFGGVVFHASK